MTESIRVAVHEESQIAEARRAARKMAHSAGFDETRSEQVALVVTEASTNLVKHAGHGEIIVCLTSAGQAADSGLEILALDHGPGMAHLERCLRDGYSTGGSHGQGLGAIQRLSNESDFYSLPGKGTGVLARWSAPAPGGAVPRGMMKVGAVNLCKPGQEVCGDSWGAVQTEEFAVILVADGLGHGLEAKTASQEAVRMLYLNSDLPPQALLERVHQALSSSRGAAVAVARLDRRRGVLAFAGMGNIMAQVYSHTRSQHLVSVNGTAGHQTQAIREFRYPWPEDGTIVVHSDGLTTNANLETSPGLASRDASLIAGILYRDFNRGHDDSTVVVAKVA